MRKIRTQADVERERKRNNVIIGVVMILLLVVAPIGYSGVQTLVVGKKTKDKIAEKTICDVRFVKIIGEYGFGQ